MRVRIPGVNKVRKRLASGTEHIYYYHRATGTRLAGKPGSPEFIASYGRAQQMISDHSAGSFNALVRAYTLSVEFQGKLAESTQGEYRRMLKAAEQAFGDMPIVALNDPRVRKEFLDWREKIARTSGNREADNRLSATSAMLTWAVDRGEIKSNHLRGFKRLYHADRSEIIWLPEHIKRFLAVAPIEIQRALILGLHTGQREGDLLRLPWSAYDGTYLRLRQGKARRGSEAGPLIEVPCTAALRKMLDSIERRSPLILTTKTGQSFKKRYFNRMWNESTRQAGLECVMLPGFEKPVTLHYHDLRGTAVTLLSAAECTPQQIATITGHSLITVARILERYLARTRDLAEQAIFNFENSPRTEFANRLQTSTPTAGSVKRKAKNDQ